LKLYRFQPLVIPGDDRLSLLQQGQIWVSDSKTFNDPFDLHPRIKNLVPDRWSCGPAFDTDMCRALACLLENPNLYQGALFIDSELAGEFQAWADRADDELDWDTRLRNAIEARIAQFGVVCLTPQWDNRLMWAHYASNGQGFCVEYEVEPFNHTQEFQYVPVQYASEMPSLCLTEAMFTPHQFLQRVMATKHADWAYEREIRLVCLNEKAKPVAVADQFVRITGLIAGYSMPTALLEPMKTTAARLGVKAFRINAKVTGAFSKEVL